MSNLTELISGVHEKVGNRKILVSIRRGLTYMIPLILLGSFALVIISLPIPAYQKFMQDVFGAEWKSIPSYIQDGTFRILSLIMLICISYSLAEEYQTDRSMYVNPIIATSVSLASFIAISGIYKEGFSIANFGVIGVFTAIVTAVSSTWLFLRLSSLSFFRIKAFPDGANSAYIYSLMSIFPAAITVAVFAAFNHFFTALLGVSHIQSFISSSLNSLFSRIKSPLLSGILFIALVHIFWFFGMHGNNILEPVAESLFIPAISVNKALIESNLLPTEIFTKTFFDTFVLMGGCGSTLCLIIAILLVERKKNQQNLAKLSLVPVYFNINELIVFGIPIVYNPIYLIPFIFVPILLTLTSYLAMFYGLVPYTSNFVEWTTPIFLSGYYSTNSISGIILQLFNLTLGVSCYMPFVKLAQKISDHQNKNSINKVYAFFKQNEKRGIVTSLLNRYDEIGSISRFLADDLENSIIKEKLMLYYQPQVNYEGKVIGFEALLRWNHENYGFIYPPLIIALSIEAQLNNKLDYWILDTACRDLRRMIDMGYGNITMSVNVSVNQLEDSKFCDKLEEILNKHKIEPGRLKLEITEQSALKSGDKLIDKIQCIKKMGVKLEMDDFGMGHSSLMYLKEYEFDTVKLDGTLVRDITTNKSCRKIISSIVDLGRTLNYSVLAEYVETREQKEILHNLGCNLFQGYLFSKPVPFNDAVNFIIESETLDSDIKIPV
ncbi:MAG: PTS sugar transporter subunit IIC/EAL domain-containing protein [Clostridiaceae bacterium]|nr:PTS sugar transporter subunit IIC/EAL domain-containing protein [Clostridiaceae bacterium]